MNQLHLGLCTNRLAASSASALAGGEYWSFDGIVCFDSFYLLHETSVSGSHIRSIP